MKLRQKSGLTFFFIFLFTLFLSVQKVRANPVMLPLGPIGNLLQLGPMFLIFVIIPITYLFTVLTEFAVYYAFFRKLSFIKNKLLKLVAFINFITVPVTQIVVYFTSMFFMSIWIYIVVEFFVFCVELVIFRDEIKERVRIDLNKKKMALIVFMANLFSFLVGLLYFRFLVNVFSDLNYVFIDGSIVVFYNITLHIILSACFYGIGHYYKHYEIAKFGAKTEASSICYCFLFVVFIVLTSFFFPAIILGKTNLLYTYFNG